MKKLLFTFCLVTLSLQAQIEVTTITPEFNGSGGLSLDQNGNLLIGDFGDFLFSDDGRLSKVWKLDTDLNLTEFSNGFSGATGNAFDNNGVFYQNDLGGIVYKFVNGVKTFVTANGFSSPIGIVFDSQNNFYVCNCNGGNVRKVEPDNTTSILTSNGFLQCPNGITIDEDDNLYVSDFSNGNIVKITPSGQQTLMGTTPGGSTSGPSNGHLDYFQPTRSLFIASMGTNKIFKMSIDNPSDLTAIVGSGVRGNTDGDANTATFSRPNGVAITQTGDSIYINSAVPLTNVPNGPINPQLIRLITGVNSILSVEDNTALLSNLSAYPNPVYNKFTIEADLLIEPQDLNIKLFDINGKTIKRITNSKVYNKHLKEEIDLSSFTPGIYFYSLYNGNKLIINGKIIKD